MPNFVEIVFIKLPDKTGKVAVLKVLWQDVLCEFLILFLKCEHLPIVN